MPIRSELADVDVPAIEGDATPVLQLQRLGEGLKVNIAVRPFGAGGPFYLAGQGGRSVLAVCDGVRQRVNRDLDAEKTASRKALIAACPSLAPWSVDDHEWRIEVLEDALEFLGEAAELRPARDLRMARRTGAQGEPPGSGRRSCPSSSRRSATGSRFRARSRWTKT